jgi:7,8-dihydropterin-6-yl-methyl-4-(beta-D-ribofuranosyl)aminobenzene 5'-phosphate synthase
VLFEPVVAPTVDALTALAPKMIVPAHCTGLSAQRALATAMPGAFVQSSVGSRYTIAAPD